MSVSQNCNFHCFHSPSMEFFGYFFPREERAERVTERIKTIFNKAQQNFHRLSHDRNSNSVGLFTLDENNRPWGVVVPSRIESPQEAIDQVIALAENAAITKSFANVMHPLLAESPAYSSGRPTILSASEAKRLDNEVAAALTIPTQEPSSSRISRPRRKRKRSTSPEPNRQRLNSPPPEPGRQQHFDISQHVIVPNQLPGFLAEGFESIPMSRFLRLTLPFEQFPFVAPPGTEFIFFPMLVPTRQIEQRPTEEES